MNNGLDLKIANNLEESILESFDSIKIQVASPETVRKWSYGEVKKAETINYRTLAPEKEGLFCQKIFGPIKDWECACGKYKRIRYRGIVCEVCGVEVTESRVRRYRMGHIKLAAPVTHIWYLKGIPSYLSLLLDSTLKELEQVIYFNAYLVLDKGNTDLKDGQILSEDAYDELSIQEDKEFEAKMGAEAVLEAINKLTKAEYEHQDKPREEKGRLLGLPGLVELVEVLNGELAQLKPSAQKRIKLVKRLRLLNKLIKAQIDPAWIVMDSVPVLPPDLRPMVQLDGGRFATSDLNDLYRRVINRNNRLLKLQEMYAPEIIIRNEKRMLQEAVDALIDNGRRGREVVGSNGRHLKSLSDIIEGKQGRFRQNLLGKRVDYSGRSVIVVGPKLKLHQCGIPAPILLELFKPFIIERIIKSGLAPNIKTAKRMIEQDLSVVWETLEEVIKDHPVLLNRAPTLHRLGIQAFQPILVEGRAIQLHPLVCSAFNADFDGDQMAIHVPLSVEAQAEARLLMMASNNLLLPSTGTPAVIPSQDMILGLYYLTIGHPRAEELPAYNAVFANIQDAISAHEEKLVHVHSKVKLRFKGELIETTIGRIIVNDIVQSSLPHNKEFRFVDEHMGKKELSILFTELYELFGTSCLAAIADKLKDLGFGYATYAGVTIGIEDLDVPKAKYSLINEAEDYMIDARKLYEKGHITEVERYNRVIDTWSETTDKVTDEVIKNLDPLNPVYMMAFSGARGNISQVRQLVGMRGLMADSQGKIIDQPITSNFREGLSVTEYVISSYGARKGIVDTALKTADSGYLTRRLVDVAQDVIISEDDCGTDRYIELEPIEGGVLSIEKRLTSRTLAEDIVHPETGELILQKNEVITRHKSKEIADAGFVKVKVRSPLTCDSARGCCAKCYGTSLATNKPVAKGEAVGIIAAQSIGEPGTQLTMRTFHTGGAVAGRASRKLLKAPSAGTVDYDTELVRETRNRYGEVVYQATRELELKVDKESFTLPTGSMIKVANSTKVVVDDVLAEYMDTSGQQLTEKAFKDVVSDRSGQVVFENFSLDRKQDRFGNISKTANQSGTIWVMEGKVYHLPANSEIIVDDSQQVEVGTVLSQSDILTEYAGVLRYSPELKTEKVKIDGSSYNKLVDGKELKVIIAGTEVSNQGRKITQNTQGVNILEINSNEKYSLKVQNNDIIENEAVLGELQSDLIPAVTSSGEIRYAEDSEKFNKKGEGKVTAYFLPEEIHSTSKDISLKNVEQGEKVVAGQEIVKDVIARMDGIVELKEENDIIYEITIRPGDVHEINDQEDLKVEEDSIIEKGTEIMKGLKAKQTSVVNLIVDEKTGQAQILVRPVEKLEIEVPKLELDFEKISKGISIDVVTQLVYKDRAKIRNFNGSPLLRTILMARISDDIGLLNGKVDLRENNFGLVIQDSIVLRKDSDNSDILIKVEDGAELEAGDSVATIQVYSKDEGEIRLCAEDDRKVLLISQENLSFIECKNAKQLEAGHYVRIGDKISTDDKQLAELCGQVVTTTDEGIILLKGRPFLISSGTQLQVETGGFVQRGDQLAILIFEQQKTGDIVQGLPKVEELLEGRKPKEPAQLSSIDGKVTIEQNPEVAGDTKIVVHNTKTDESVSYDLLTHQNIIVESGQEVTKGQALTDGASTPHDILALLGQQAVQMYLINEVQGVYCSQGVHISDKHIEVIVNQMTSKVKIDDAGSTILLPGEMMQLSKVQKANAELMNDEEPATFTHVLLGITKASLNTESFMSAASFQETTRILTESSLEGKIDPLQGLKENIIAGKLIPGGTGYAAKIKRETDRMRQKKAQEDLFQAPQEQQPQEVSSALLIE